ncbi:Arginase/agmatinase/formiminoglutamase [Paracoccus denitrificans PD1222]|uniref:Arginase/agmatinase/formiminoglutamase n=2 Tax=Paracoccus denitrificans TaxID=266 RepID=A1B175_PARDP|nr:Arginase/agmatinase/formiminoglutamase [Paracoccus denitrificans PD1222]
MSGLSSLDASGVARGVLWTGPSLHPVACNRKSEFFNDPWTASMMPRGDMRFSCGSGELGAGFASVAGQCPLVVANTCSASVATLPAAARMIDGLRVLWVDAHGDFNTPETTGTGYLGGMALAGACGLWRTGHGGEVSPARVALLAARDIDPPEEALLAQAGVHRFVAGAEPETVLAALGEGPIWLHVDWDAMEPGTVPAAYSVPGGLTPGRLRAFLAAIPPQQIAGVELAEFEMPGTAQAAQGAIATILDIVGPLRPPGR